MISFNRLSEWLRRGYSSRFCPNIDVDMLEEGITSWIDEDYIFDRNNTFPIVFREEYSVSNFLDEETIALYESRSRWDFRRYNKIVQSIIDDKEEFVNIKSINNFIPSRVVTEEELLLHHTEEYLSYVQSEQGFSEIFVLRKKIRDHLHQNPKLLELFIESLKYRVAGTILSGELALLYGFSTMFGGGGSHHASANNGGGWCGFADIQLCIKNLMSRYGLEKVMVVDLDAHQSNGITIDLSTGNLGSGQVFLVDVFNQDIWPYRSINQNNENYEANISIKISSGISDSEYLEIITDAIEHSIDVFGSPELLVYVSGTDILSDDVYGRLNVSASALLERDEIVFQKFYEDLGIPVCMTMAGGYVHDSWKVTVDSLKNLQRKFEIIKM